MRNIRSPVKPNVTRLHPRLLFRYTTAMHTDRRNRPHLIRADIAAILAPLVERAGHPALLRQLDATGTIELADLVSTYMVAQHAQTILFATAQALALKPALDRFAEQVLEYRLPFPSTLLQFTEPIGESQLLPYPLEVEAPPDAVPGEDRILALLLTQTTGEDGRLLNTAGAWFQSKSVSRVTWYDDPHAHLELPDPDLPDAAGRLANKQALRALAIACIAYINCENITLAHQPADAKLNRSRISKGKKPFDDYYLCRLVTRRGQEGGESAEAGHSPGHRFDVRGHFRRLPNGKLTWVRAHQRGLAHELYVPSVRKVE
jgi:hypothetical protein